jgi:hypothetical protein
MSHLTCNVALTYLQGGAQAVLAVGMRRQGGQAATQHSATVHAVSLRAHVEQCSAHENSSCARSHLVPAS